ncbi:MAG: hypothetical protein ACC726_01170 [Chloroflexota bacterium]
MTRKKRKKKKRLSVAEKSRRMTARDARRAITFDFEGRKGYRPRPDLIGVFDPFEPPHSRSYQLVLSENLRGAAKAGDGRAVGDLSVVMERLVARADANKAFLVSYSQFDRAMVEKWVGRDDPALYKRFERVYRDARARAKLWARSNDYVRLMRADEDFNLQRCLDFIGYSCRRNYRDADVSATLRLLHEHLKAGRKYMKLGKRDKRRWHDVLGHNRCDVEGTRELLLISTGAREWQPAQS